MNQQRHRLKILQPITEGLRTQAAMEPLLLNQMLEVLLDIRELLQTAHERETATCGLCGYRHAEGRECV